MAKNRRIGRIEVECISPQSNMNIVTLSHVALAMRDAGYFPKGSRKIDIRADGIYFEYKYFNEMSLVYKLKHSKLDDEVISYINRRISGI